MSFERKSLKDTLLTMLMQLVPSWGKTASQIADTTCSDEKSDLEICSDGHYPSFVHLHTENDTNVTFSVVCT